MAMGYGSSLEHVLEELARIELMVRRRVLMWRMAHPDEGRDEFRGLYISEGEVDEHLRAKEGLPRPLDSHPLYAESQQALQALEAQVAERKAAALKEGKDLRLERLGAIFGLSRGEVDALLIALAPELDLKYERLYSYLANDVTKKSPSINLALDLLYSSFPEKLAGRGFFSSASPLVYWQVLRLFDDPPGRPAPLLAKGMKLDERVRDYLLDSDEIDARIAPFARLYSQGKEGPVSEADPRAKLLELVRSHGEKGLAFFFSGGYGVGKRALAERLARELGLGLLVMDLVRMLEGELPFPEGVRLSLREALLQDAAPYWDRFEVLLGEDRAGLREMLVRELEAHPRLSFLAGARPWQPAGSLLAIPFVQVDLPIPPYETRKELWKLSLDKALSPAEDVDTTALANKFRLSGGQIRDAVATARDLALKGGESHITMADLEEAARTHSTPNLGHLARKVSPHYAWKDIVLPPDQVEQLRELLGFVKYRPLVYGDWGFGRKLALGRGLNVLFAGPAGTGKTMAAEVIAGELGLDLYKIDLALVVSKYIGETEKNLSHIFQEAETGNSILFFDEADALFGKRSEVRDAHDRYANIEVAYLLQKMEEYEGIAILATNLRQNLDEAFVRRMHFALDFPFPDEEYRRRIWEVTSPPEMPRAQDIDFDFLARNFRLSGGNIRNIVLAAAFLAAEDGRVVGMEHLIRATKREYQKMGKLVVESDFGKYYAVK